MLFYVQGALFTVLTLFTKFCFRNITNGIPLKLDYNILYITYIKLISEKIGGVCGVEVLHIFNMRWYTSQTSKMVCNFPLQFLHSTRILL